MQRIVPARTRRDDGRPTRVGSPLQAPVLRADVAALRRRATLQNATRTASCAWKGGAASVNCPKVGSGLPGYAPVPKTLSTFV